MTKILRVKHTGKTGKIFLSAIWLSANPEGNYVEDKIVEPEDIEIIETVLDEFVELARHSDGSKLYHISDQVEFRPNLYLLLQSCGSFCSFRVATTTPGSNSLAPIQRGNLTPKHSCSFRSTRPSSAESFDSVHSAFSLGE